jgi:glycosyltransferase involved in cell wall biosynthesis
MSASCALIADDTSGITLYRLASVGRPRRYRLMAERVTLLHGSNDTYGASRVLVDDARALRSLGWEVQVLLPEDGPLTSLLNDVGARVELHDLHVLRRVSLRRTRLPLHLPATVASSDLVVLWTMALAPYLPILAQRAKPTICSVHEIQPGTAGTVLAWTVARLADGLMANSSATAAWLRECGGRRGNAVVAYPVAPAYDPLPAPPADQPFHVLVAGRVNGHKGHVEAVSACRLARAAGLDLRLTLLGSPYPGQEGHLDALLRAIDGEDWIAYPGEVESIRPYLADANVLLVPTTKPEPFGIVALEGWAAGRLVLASDIGGLSEAADLVGGVKFPPCDVHGIARVLLDVSRNSGSAEPPNGSAAAAGLCSLAQREAAWQELLASGMKNRRSLDASTKGYAG